MVKQSKGDADLNVRSKEDVEVRIDSLLSPEREPVLLSHFQELDREYSGLATVEEKSFKIPWHLAMESNRSGVKSWKERPDYRWHPACQQTGQGFLFLSNYKVLDAQVLERVPTGISITNWNPENPLGFAAWAYMGYQALNQGIYVSEHWITLTDDTTVRLQSYPRQILHQSRHEGEDLLQVLKRTAVFFRPTNTYIAGLFRVEISKRNGKAIKRITIFRPDKNLWFNNIP